MNCQGIRDLVFIYGVIPRSVHGRSRKVLTGSLCLTPDTTVDLPVAKDMGAGQLIAGEEKTVIFIGSFNLEFVNDLRKEPVSHLPSPDGTGMRGNNRISMDTQELVRYRSDPHRTAGQSRRCPL
jgi:hypothetical protein